jgi:hypothetical protein
MPKNLTRMTDCGKLVEIFKPFITVYFTLYKPSEHLATDEAIMLFKGRVVFEQYT